MCKCLTKEDIFLDIGANLGIYSFLAKELGAFSIVFEPEPYHYEFLKRNTLFCNKFFKIALSDKKGERNFYIFNESNPGANSLIMSNKGFLEGGYHSVMRVKTQRLDNIII